MQEQTGSLFSFLKNYPSTLDLITPDQIAMKTSQHGNVCLNKWMQDWVKNYWNIMKLLRATMKLYNDVRFLTSTIDYLVVENIKYTRIWDL